jgi:hypothetical protein
LEVNLSLFEDEGQTFQKQKSPFAGAFEMGRMEWSGMTGRLKWGCSKS